jgi:enterochelin esterase-like enzyme
MPRLPGSRQPAGAPGRPPTAKYDTRDASWTGHRTPGVGVAGPVIRSTATGYRPRGTAQRRDTFSRRSAVQGARHAALVPEAGAFFAGVCAPPVLMGLGLVAPLAVSLTALDLDAERVTLVSWLVLMLAGGLLVGALTRRRLPVLLGAVVAYGVWYLAPFVIQAQHPQAGPAGLHEALLPGALLSLIGMLLALGVTFAGLGAVAGAALGELLVEPALALARRLWPALDRRHDAPRPSPLRAGVMLAAGVLLVVSALIGLTALEPLLTDGLSTGLYQLAPGVHAGAAGSIPKGVVLQETYPSPALGGAMRTVCIYLPPTYASARSTRFPVIYLLHGHPGHAPNWFVSGHAAQIEDALIAASRVRPLIMVAPDGNGTAYPTSQWANSYTHLQQMEDSVASDLVRWIDAHYRTLADRADRLIAGNSEGGFGAVNIALHHPEVFGAAISLGGYFEAVGNVFGEGPAAAAYHAYNSPAQYVLTPAGRSAAHRIRFVIGVGATDHTYYATGVNFVNTLAGIGVGARLLVDPGGHSWTIWSAQLGDALSGLVPPTR